MNRAGVQERILEYLRGRGSPATADEVLRAALGIISPNSAAAERVLGSIVAGDGRFRAASGRWSPAPEQECLPAWPRVAVLFLQATGGGERMRGAILVRGPARSRLLSWSDDPRSLRAAREASDGCLLAAWSHSEFRLWNRLLARHSLPAHPGKPLRLPVLAARVLPHCRAATAPEDLASRLGLATPDAEDPAAMARFYAEVLQSLLDQVPAARRQDVPALMSWMESDRPRVDFSRFKFGRKLLDEIPEKPGIYIMRNRAGDIIYVGKSENLRKRVRSYFTSSALKDAKVARIHEQLHALEFTPTANEVEALVLEMQLIRDFQPPINLQTRIHEGPARYGRERNLIILVGTEPPADAATAYLIRDSVFAGCERVRLGRGPGKRLLARIRSVYFSRRSRRDSEDSWEQELISRWLRANRRGLNAVDVDQAGSFAAVVGRLKDYLHDPDRLSAIVFYR